jgi:hypothetical protein
MQRSVSVANQRSTGLSHEASVGVKWTWKQMRLTSQRWMAGILCVA